MEALLLTLALVLLVGGIIFSVLPPLPGPILAYGALILTHYSSDETTISTGWFVFLGIGVAVVTVMDFLMPAVATKKFGGTKAGVWGGLIGTMIGVFSPIPFGIIWGPLLGAIVGDMIGGNQIKAAMKSGFAAFVGFIVATLFKVLYSVLVGAVIIWEIGSLMIDTIMGWF